MAPFSRNSIRVKVAAAGGWAHHLGLCTGFRQSLGFWIQWRKKCMSVVSTAQLRTWWRSMWGLLRSGSCGCYLVCWWLCTSSRARSGGSRCGIREWMGFAWPANVLWLRFFWNLAISARVGALVGWEGKRRRKRSRLLQGLWFGSKEVGERC